MIVFTILSSIKQDDMHTIVMVKFSSFIWYACLKIFICLCFLPYHILTELLQQMSHFSIAPRVAFYITLHLK